MTLLEIIQSYRYELLAHGPKAAANWLQGIGIEPNVIEMVIGCYDEKGNVRNLSR